ncbi:MAG: hypothetical protein NC113_09880 [Bacteroides sp.]|nr:hypothetical protein [Bacteroides sp.]MCM1448503.1 hypothetical protein [Bacteroides sp.]MCM1516771.1 hypothetical protein [Paraprevotella sp.]
MDTLKIGITHADQNGLDTINEAFEDILLDEICTKTLYESKGEAAIEEALNDWEQGNTDAIIVVAAQGEEKLNPAGLRGLDMIVWGDLRMAFANDGKDLEEQTKILRLTLAREFDINHPRIAWHLDAENYKTYDAVMTTDREQGLKDFMQLSQGNGVAYTTGRELICTCPFSNDSFHESIYLAKDIFMARERYDSARVNPLPKLFIERREDNRKKQ